MKNHKQISNFKFQISNFKFLKTRLGGLHVTGRKY